MQNNLSIIANSVKGFAHLSRGVVRGRLGVLLCPDYIEESDPPSSAATDTKVRASVRQVNREPAH